MAATLYAEDRSTGTVPFLISVTERAPVIECERPPDVPMIVTVDVPSLAEASAVRVNLLVVEVLVGLNEAVTPGGSPDTLRLTLDLKLPRRLTVRVVVAPLPLGTETPSPGLRSAKSSASGGGGARRS